MEFFIDKMSGYAGVFQFLFQQAIVKKDAMTFNISLV